MKVYISKYRNHWFSPLTWVDYAFFWTDQRRAGNGVRVTEYVLGKPSRNMVALAYKAQSLGITL